jgi:Uma2 family endonuclease
MRPAGLSIEEFLAFTATRPKGERWELVEGQPVLNPSPLRIHQQIAGNIYRALWDAKERLDAQWVPLLGIGMVVPHSRNSLPVPDLHVLEHNAGGEHSHTTEDSLVLFEVLSQSNTRARRAWRRKVYASVPNCQHYLTIATRKVEIRRYDRLNQWEERVLTAADREVALPALGVTLSMADIYRHTQLAKD